MRVRVSWSVLFYYSADVPTLVSVGAVPTFPDTGILPVD
jgi:hypothetical protein